MIVQERESRKEHNQSIFDMIVELEDKIDIEITEEAKLREKCEQQI